MVEYYYPVLVCVAALLIDRMFGEPGNHPLVMFGNLAIFVERQFNDQQSRLRGALALAIIVGIPVIIVFWLQSVIQNFWLKMTFDILVLYLVIGWQSMKEHALNVVQPLQQGQLQQARAQLAMIVSRDTATMDESLVVGSTLESVLENGNDSLFGSLFWFALAGPAGAILHRLVNTLDAMWGYRNTRFEKFGFAAARLDDLLGWIPARLTAFGYALSGSFGNAIRAWRNQIGHHKSPNAGLVMATGAGTMGYTIGGPISYDGVVQQKPWLGIGPGAALTDIKRTLNMIDKTVVIWLLVYSLVLTMMAYLQI